MQRPSVRRRAPASARCAGLRAQLMRCVFRKERGRAREGKLAESSERTLRRSALARKILPAGPRLPALRKARDQWDAAAGEPAVERSPTRSKEQQ